MARALGCGGLLLALGAGSAAADTEGGSLGPEAAAAHLYQVNCFDDGQHGAPASLAVQISSREATSTPLVSVQVQRGALATSSTDESDGASAPSPLVAVNGGAGMYNVFVDKTDAGPENYVLSYTCMSGPNGTGARTGTTLTAGGGGGPTPVPGLSSLGMLCLAMLLTVIGQARIARAHTQTGSLGSAAAATDYYQVTCTEDSTQLLQVDIKDEAPVAPPLVSVQVRKGALLASSTDPTDGDAAGSPPVQLSGGAGVYDVLVDKSGAGGESYTLTFHCLNGALHTDTQITARQNQ